MCYAKRLLYRAKLDTCQYWNAPQIIATVVVPITSGIAWVAFKPWEGWWPIMQVALVSLLGFLAAWGAVFLGCCLLAPAKLHADLEKENSDLRISIRAVSVPPLEQGKRRSVAEKLKGFREEERVVLRHILEHGTTSPGELRLAGFEFQALTAATNKAVQRQILTRDLRNGIEYFTVNASLQDALSFHLHQD